MSFSPADIFITAAANKDGPLDWGGMANFANAARLASMDPLSGATGQAFGNMPGMMAGLSNTIGGAVQGNVARLAANRQREEDIKLAQDERDRKQSNFLMMFKTLLGDPDNKMYDRESNTMVAQSPLLRALSRSVGGTVAGNPGMTGAPIVGVNQLPMLPVAGLGVGGYQPQPANAWGNAPYLLQQ